MTSPQDWPKPDLLQQRRLELGLPLDPAPVPLPLSLLSKGVMGALVLVMLAVLTLLGLQHRQRLVQSEVDALNPVERRVGDAKARLRAMTSRRSSLEQQTQSIAEQLVAVRSGSALFEQLRRVTPQGCASCRSTPTLPNCSSRGNPKERMPSSGSTPWISTLKPCRACSSMAQPL